MGKFFVGTSGFGYVHWYGKFYPEDLPKNKLLDYYGREFSTVELNQTFYMLPRENTIKNWCKRVGENFVFSVKASQFITHKKKLRDVEESLQLFYKVLEKFGRKLGPVLFQLPPFLTKNEELLENFLKVLPEKFLNVIEFRNKSWFSDSVFELLKKYNTSCCVVSMPEFPPIFKKTGSFVYVRMHGSSALYSSCYTKKELIWWADKIKEASEGSDAYIYFNNDAQGYAVENAITLRGLLVKEE